MRDATFPRYYTEDMVTSPRFKWSKASTSSRLMVMYLVRRRCQHISQHTSRQNAICAIAASPSFTSERNRLRDTRWRGRDRSKFRCFITAW